MKTSIQSRSSDPSPRSAAACVRHWACQSHGTRRWLATVALIAALTGTAPAQVPGIINYQGRVTSAGTNFTGTGQFKFALVNSDASQTYWSSGANPVERPVTKGLYSVLLGDTTIPNMSTAIPAAVFTNTDVRLRLWFNDGVSGLQQLHPDQRIAAAGYALAVANVRAVGGNTFVGEAAGNSTMTGNYNTASGYRALYANTTGLFNTANGYLALAANTTGADNIALGYRAGDQLTTGNDNINIGHRGVAGEASTIRLGTQGTQTNTYVAGIYGATAPAEAVVLVSSNGQLSSGRVSGNLLASDLVISGSLTAGSFLGNFSGDGSALTNLNAANINSGTLNDLRLSANMAKLNANQTFTGTDTFAGGIRMADQNIHLRSDPNHGLGWYGTGKLFAGSAIDGPVLFGFTGGALGSIAPDTIALYWNWGGQVGIGTSNPGCSLQVNGGIRARGGAPGSTGTNNNGYAFSGNSGDNDSGMFSTADGQLEFYANAGEAMRLTRRGIVLNGQAGEQPYLGGDGGGNDVELGSANAAITGVSLWNSATGTRMDLHVRTITIYGGADVAEPFEMSGGDIPKGAVVVIDEANPGRLKLSKRAYDTRVAGIVSGANGVKPGLMLSQQGVMEGNENVALSGRVYVLADASNGPIKPGDLLTTSDIPGHAMKVTDHANAQGAILGKAMSALSGGQGMVLVLVSLQ